jgi:hypothetical protein
MPFGPTRRQLVLASGASLAAPFVQAEAGWPNRPVDSSSCRSRAAAAPTRSRGR